MQWASNALVPASRDTLVRVRSGLGEGLVFRVHPRWEWPVWDGTYEAAVQGLLDQVLRLGLNFYDVGGGMGFFTCCAAKRGARVFVFEPDKANADCLERHLVMNGLTELVTVERMAAYSHSGTVHVAAPALRASHGNAVVGKGGEAIVDCTALDDYCLHHPFPDVCKIDVEGSESEVLKGAEGLFVTGRPIAVLEVHDRSNAQFVELFFKARGYRMQSLGSGDAFPKHVAALPNEAIRLLGEAV